MLNFNIYKDETCLQFEMKKQYIKTWKISCIYILKTNRDSRQVGAPGVDLMHEIVLLHTRVLRASERNGARVVNKNVDPPEP